jgi:anion-transporting  ArsA/GET3 family ATPase
MLDELFSRRLVILSGKGGVGKSVVGTALALTARDRGKRVLFVEVDAPLPAARYLGVKPPPPAPSSEPVEALPGLFMVNLRPRDVMDEYVSSTVRFDFLTRRVLESPVYHRFFAAAPGLPELMTLGKIMVLEESRSGFSRRPTWDLIIVDAPATGHGLAFLKVPVAASRAVPVGPVGHNARRILELLRDPRRTALCVVAIPEEMAVVEALEFRRMAAEEVDVQTRLLVLNECHERRLTAAQEAEVLALAKDEPEGRLAPGVGLQAALLAARRHIRRRKLTEFYRKRLRRAADVPLVSLPFLFEETLGRDSLELLARRLEAA